MPSTLLLNPRINITLPLDPIPPHSLLPPLYTHSHITPPSFQFSCNNCKRIRGVAYLYIYYIYTIYLLKEQRKQYAVKMDKYEMVKDLGAGNFGVARLLRHKETKELVAMKYIERGHRVGVSSFSVCFPRKNEENKYH
jgi:hypothetical protein